MLKTFYDKGVVDDSRYTYAPMSFKVGLGYTTMMKLGVAAAIFIIIVLIGIVWLIIRKIHKKKMRHKRKR